MNVVKKQIRLGKKNEGDSKDTGKTRGVRDGGHIRKGSKVMMI